MKTHPRKLAALLLLSACCFTPAAIYAATMASQPWVTNRIAEAEARTDVKIAAATNAIPAPGDYATVSNRAMNAVMNDEFGEALGTALDDGGWDMFFDWLPLGLGYIDEISPRYYRINHSVYLTNDVVEILATSGVGGYFKIEREDGTGFCMTNGAMELWGNLEIARVGMVDSLWDLSGLYELHLPQTVHIGHSGPELNLADVATHQQATNAAVAVVASATNGLQEAIGRKQDALPYPTNAIPYAAISGAPSGGGQEWRVDNQSSYEIHYVTNGMANVQMGAELSCNTNGWGDGAAMFARLTIQSGLSYEVMDDRIRLVGYGTWPTNNFQSVWWRSGTNIFVNILLEE